MNPPEIILGLDISTSTIGMCGMNREKELIFLSYISLKKQKDLFEKADAFLVELEENCGIVSHVAIEEPLVMYKEGFSRAQILSKLSMFNGMCSILTKTLYNTVPVHYNVNTARKLAFGDMKFPKGSERKKIVQARVALEYPEVDWPLKPRVGTLKDECFDMADSVIIARAHAEVLRNESYR